MDSSIQNKAKKEISVPAWHVLDPTIQKGTHADLNVVFVILVKPVTRLKNLFSKGDGAGSMSGDEIFQMIASLRIRNEDISRKNFTMTGTP